MNKLLISIPTTLALAAAVQAQTGIVIDPMNRRGVASALASGLSYASPAGSDAIFIKGPGRQGAAPNEWSTGSYYGPVYTAQAMFGALASFVEIDAHSSGNDVIPGLTNDGQIDLTGGTFNNWLGVTVSYAEDAEGLENSLLARARAGGSPGAHLIGYYFEDSQGIHSSLPGRVMLEQDPATMGITGDIPDIDGLDWGVGVWSHLPPSTTTVWFTRQNTYFFSVTADSADQLNDPRNNLPRFAKQSSSDPTPTLQADPGVIYRIDNLGGGWTVPHVYRSRAQLHLQPEEDLDAIAVDEGHDTTIFSVKIRPAVPRPQLFVNGPTPSSGAALLTFELKDGAERVTDKIGSIDDRDEVDAVCTEDPEGGTFAFLLGTPFDQLPGPGDPMGTSVTRSGTELTVQLTGFGSGGPQDGTVELYARLAVPTAPWGLVTSSGRSASQETMDFTFPSLFGQGAGADIQVAAVFYGEDGGVSSTSWATIFKE